MQWSGFPKPPHKLQECVQHQATWVRALLIPLIPAIPEQSCSLALGYDCHITGKRRAGPWPGVGLMVDHSAALWGLCGESHPHLPIGPMCLPDLGQGQALGQPSWPRAAAKVPPGCRATGSSPRYLCTSGPWAVDPPVENCSIRWPSSKRCTQEWYNHR